YGEVTRRLAAAGVEMLIVGVDRNCKHASRSPLEGMLLAVSLPDRGRAIALGDVDHLLIEMFLRLRLTARRDLANVRVVSAAGTVKNNERTGNAFQVPVFEFDFVNFLDEEPPYDRDPLLFLPVPVGIDSFRFEILWSMINCH